MNAKKEVSQDWCAKFVPQTNFDHFPNFDYGEHFFLTIIFTIVLSFGQSQCLLTTVFGSRTLRGGGDGREGNSSVEEGCVGSSRAGDQ